MERLKNARIKVVGTKQTQKAIEKCQTQVVYVARDAEERVISPIVRLCEEKNLELVLVDSMSELGKACGIKVGAAAASGPPRGSRLEGSKGRKGNRVILSRNIEKIQEEYGSRQLNKLKQTWK